MSRSNCEIDSQYDQTEKIFGYDRSRTSKQSFEAMRLPKVNELLNLSEGDDLEAQTINQARVLEGRFEIPEFMPVG